MQRDRIPIRLHVLGEDTQKAIEANEDLAQDTMRLYPMFYPALLCGWRIFPGVENPPRGCV